MVWEPKTIYIQEDRNLITLAWDELLGILRVLEVHLQKRDHLPKKDFTALKFGETSYKIKENKSSFKALRVKMFEFDGSDNNFGGSTNDEMDLMSEKFKQMLEMKGKFQHFSKTKDTRFKKKYKEETNKIICFECRKPKHMKVERPQLKKKRYSSHKKKKSLMVIWDDSDSEKSSSSDDEQVNIYLMANTNENVEISLEGKD